MYFLKLLYENYVYFFEMNCDPRVKHLFLMKNPLPVLFLIGLYLKFVTHWGPKFMKNRPAYNLNGLMIIYNILQIVLNLRLFLLSITYTYGFGGYSLICEPLDSSESEVALIIANGCHTYVMLKILDCFDTVFFILRKKEKQVTFLHIYHHAGVLALAWSACKVYPGGNSVFTGFLNTFVHVVMYGYYLYALINPNKKNIWWKKYLTQMQIIQFVLIILNSVALLLGPECGYPKWSVVLTIPQNAFLTAMFTDFYIKTYVRKSK